MAKNTMDSRLREALIAVMEEQEKPPSPEVQAKRGRLLEILAWSNEEPAD